MGINYKKSKIYRIVSKNSEKIFVGSTVNKSLHTRYSKHKCDYDNWKYDPNSIAYQDVFDVLKYDNCEMELIENYPCNSKEELDARLRKWIVKYRPNVVNKSKYNKFVKYSGHTIQCIYCGDNIPHAHYYEYHVKSDKHNKNKLIIDKLNKDIKPIKKIKSPKPKYKFIVKIEENDQKIFDETDLQCPIF